MRFNEIGPISSYATDSTAKMFCDGFLCTLLKICWVPHIALQLHQNGLNFYVYLEKGNILFSAIFRLLWWLASVCCTSTSICILSSVWLVLEWKLLYIFSKAYWCFICDTIQMFFTFDTQKLKCYCIINLGE